jgi:hypothetical protein
VVNLPFWGFISVRMGASDGKFTLEDDGSGEIIRLPSCSFSVAALSRFEKSIPGGEGTGESSSETIRFEGVPEFDDDGVPSDFRCGN